MSRNYAIYLGWDLMNLFQSVVIYDKIEGDSIEIETLSGERYKVPVKDIRKIMSPRYSIGDKVSPTNHPEIVGIIHSISYYFKTEEPCYTISVNGRSKSKRYFSRDLIRHTCK